MTCEGKGSTSSKEADNDAADQHGWHTSMPRGTAWQVQQSSWSGILWKAEFSKLVVLIAVAPCTNLCFEAPAPAPTTAVLRQKISQEPISDSATECKSQHVTHISYSIVQSLNGMYESSKSRCLHTTPGLLRASCINPITPRIARTQLSSNVHHHTRALHLGQACPTTDPPLKQAM